MAKIARATDRWEFRVEAQADELVRRAADVSHRTLTDFVVQAAVVEGMHGREIDGDDFAGTGPEECAIRHGDDVYWRRDGRGGDY